jgi:hypothetical protein
MAKKRWADLSAGQRISVIILGTLQVGLLAAALWDLVHQSPEDVRGDRRMWAGLVFINWIGPLTYFTIGRKGSFACPWLRGCAPSFSESEPSPAKPDTHPDTYSI